MSDEVDDFGIRVDRYFASMSLAKLRKVAKFRKRGDKWKVEVRHSVGFGGSRNYTAHIASPKDGVLKAIHASFQAAKAEGGAK